jgi:hypothetical protein
MNLGIRQGVLDAVQFFRPAVESIARTHLRHPQQPVIILHDLSLDNCNFFPSGVQARQVCGTTKILPVTSTPLPRKPERLFERSSYILPPEAAHQAGEASSTSFSAAARGWIRRVATTG